ncbi:TPA: hypothetical protein OW314_001035 [Pseudomonas aeruginosa]|uniref:hypothetical protein n=1 Tax=Pseudomonas aeruginosa TaxID=287 RepID=UPI000D729A8A|nr:hypothetical protein [Pseudomonas aeruginosa]EKW7738072.1 hypothetical protein [Pseudomonas aeruginosa]PXB79350.1 hypothetical protein C0045_03670 [Pseudomonas aeruginosa]HCE6017638.1 hypothetical protein [Pseudomonas aeruginosa]HCF9570204.1 hypothetical protein [Pseudomonas aeruginosa]HCW0203325.1 hypothetical protein [Pseudomonas aeruginosa]
MSEVERFDVPSMRSLTQGEQAVMGYEVVLASDYDALAAKLAMAEDAAAKGDAARQQCGGMEMEIEELRAEAQALRDERDSQQRVAIKAMEELAALRARVVVVPERKLLNAGVPGLNRNSGWNACLDELARLNGKTVSEGLLRLALEFIMATNCQGSIPLGLIEELRALLNQDKENGNG